jgi:hypothetical protein
MKFNLKFDVEVYNKQMDLLFNLAWKKKKEYYKNSHYLGFILLIITVILILDRPSFFYFGIAFFSLGILIPYFYYYFKIKSQYKKIETAKALEIEMLQNQNEISWEFTNSSLIMRSSQGERELNWNEFLTHFEKEDNLFMITKTYEPFILGKIEVGKDNFKVIVDFVSTKISH